MNKSEIQLPSMTPIPPTQGIPSTTPLRNKPEIPMPNPTPVSDPASSPEIADPDNIPEITPLRM